MTGFSYQEPFPLGEDTTEYNLLTDAHVKSITLGDKNFVSVEPEGLALLARTAMRNVSFYLRSAHNAKVAEILGDPEASENDRFVARTLLGTQ